MLTLKQAADQLGIGRETIRRAILSGDLAATPTAGPGGKVYLVTAEDAQAWFDNRFLRAANSNIADSEVAATGTVWGAGASLGNSGGAGAAGAATPDPSVPLVQLANKLLDQVAALQAQLDDARESEHRERRRADALTYELTSYQRALSETAESLAEQRAALLQSEAQRLAAEMVTSTVAASRLEHQVELEQLKIDMPTPARGWGSRLKRLLFRKVG